MASKLYSVTNSYVYNIPGLWEEVQVPQRAEEPWHEGGDCTDPYDAPWVRLGNAVAIMAVIDYLEAWKATEAGRFVPYENRRAMIWKEYFSTTDERRQLFNDIHIKVIDKGDRAIDECIQRLKRELGWLKNKKGA